MKLNCLMCCDCLFIKSSEDIEEIFKDLDIPYEIDLDEIGIYVRFSNIAGALYKLSFDKRISSIEIV